MMLRHLHGFLSLYKQTGPFRLQRANNNSLQFTADQPCLDQPLLTEVRSLRRRETNERRNKKKSLDESPGLPIQK